MGGWTFEPWDSPFYPDKLSKAKQLQFASRQVPTIEVNGTFYSSFKEHDFVKWASESPDGFVYSLKGNRFVTNRRVLGEAGEFDDAIPRFRPRSSATSSGRSCGSSRRPRNSTRTISTPSWSCCRKSRTA